MLNPKTIEKIYTPELFNSFIPTVQIISIKIEHSGYIFTISDSLNYAKSFFPSLTPIPELFSIISLENFQILRKNSLILIISFKIISNFPKIGNPTKYKSIDNKIKNFGFTSINCLRFGINYLLIKVRIIDKIVIEKRKKHEEQKFCKILLIDEKNNEISAIFYQEQFDSFFVYLQKGCVYVFSNVTLKKNSKHFENFLGKTYILIDKNSKITQVFDENSIPNDHYNLIDIKSLYKLNSSKRVDVTGKISEISHDKTSFIEIIDSSNTSIQLFYSNFNSEFKKDSIILAKNVEFEPFSGILISDSSSKIVVNPKKFEKSLKNCEEKYKNSNSLYTISEILNMIDDSTLPLEFELYGTVGEVINTEYRPFWYPGCKNIEKCSKKIEFHSDGYYFCKDCDEKSNFFVEKYCLELILYDCTGKISLKAFDNVGKSFFGITASELVKIYYRNVLEFSSIFYHPIGQQIKVRINSQQIGNSIPIQKFTWTEPLVLSKILLSEISSVL